MSGGSDAGTAPRCPDPLDQFRALDQALSHAGFTSFDVRYGGPDEQTVSVDDSWGSTLQFTLEPDSTTFSLQSTCNLLPSAKRPPR
jgi:hypothetical protein